MMEVQSEMEKLDFKKIFKHLYSPSTEVERVTIPPMQFLMVDGTGDPAGADFQNAIGALYGVAYTVKFDRKKSGFGPDYSIAPLEGLWWMEDMDGFDPYRRDDWRWRAMLWQPDFITHDDVSAAAEKLSVKKPSPALAKLRLESFEEGTAIQVMHIGPYSSETKSIKKLDEYAQENNLKMHGKHHEIYMGDPRRSAPDKLKTILRHPVSDTLEA